MVEIRQLSKWFDRVEAIRRLDLAVEEGEFLVILGPSGCGKTTTLRCIAGVEEPTTGEIYFGETCVYSDSLGINVPPKTRDVGLVFQNYALYPHMTVLQNVTFGLKIRKLKADIVESRAKEAISFVGLDGLEERHPAELSGGQQQRVALARVVAKKASILLYDEPLSNLDPKLRSSIRAELKSLHTRLGATSVFVTHDQREAMILGERIAVMSNGAIDQIGLPDDIYHFPSSVSVAQFTGRPKTNFIHGLIEQSEGPTTHVRSSVDPEIRLDLSDRVNLASGQAMIVHVRPEELDIDMATEIRPFSVYAVQPQGSETLVHLRFCAGDGGLLVRTTNNRAVELAFGQPVGITIRRGNIFSPETKLLIQSFGTVNDSARTIRSSGDRQKA